MQNFVLTKILYFYEKISLRMGVWLLKHVFLGSGTRSRYVWALGFRNTQNFVFTEFYSFL
jgi:hypothetical protein